MSDTNHIDTIIDQYLQYLEGTAPEPDLASLGPGDRREAAAQIEVLRALHRAGTPAPDDDPVARRFGFDRADTDITIDGRQVKRLRQARDLALKDLVGMTNHAGGSTTTAALLKLEQQPRAVVPQATASALVAALHTTLGELEPSERSIDEEVDRMRAFLASPDFENEIARWAEAHDRPAVDVRRHVEQRLVGADFRAEDQTDEVLLEIVRAILDKLEP